MFTLIDMKMQGPVIHFTFGTDNPLDDGEWHHSALAEPVITCLENELLPLARVRGGAVTPEEIRESVAAWAVRKRLAPAAFDWLAAALYAARQSLAAMARFGNPGVTAEMETDFAAKNGLARGLAELYRRVVATACSPLPAGVGGNGTPAPSTAKDTTAA